MAATLPDTVASDFLAALGDELTANQANPQNGMDAAKGAAAKDAASPEGAVVASDVGELAVLANLAGANEKAAASGDSTNGELRPCNKCRVVFQPWKNEIAGGAPPECICKACNAKRTACSKLFGKWPIDLFKMLSEPQQVDFWRSDCKSKDDVEHALAKQLIRKEEEILRTKSSGEYLPLEVYQARGFNSDKIKKDCKDCELHPVLGMTYRVSIKMKEEETIKTKVWEDLLNIRTAAAKRKRGSRSKAKGGNKKKKRSSSSSSDSSSSNSAQTKANDEPKESLAEARKRKAAEIKAAREHAKEERAAEKAAANALDKEKKDVAKKLCAEFKEKAKARSRTQTAFGQVATHLRMLEELTSKLASNHSEEEVFKDAIGKLNDGQALLNEIADALKVGANHAGDAVREFASSTKQTVAILKKLEKGS